MTPGKNTAAPVLQAISKRKLFQMVAVVKAVASDPHDRKRKYNLFQLCIKYRKTFLPKNRSADPDFSLCQLLLKHSLIEMRRKRIRPDLRHRKSVNLFRNHSFRIT